MVDIYLQTPAYALTGCRVCTIASYNGNLNAEDHQIAYIHIVSSFPLSLLMFWVQRTDDIHISWSLLASLPPDALFKVSF